MSLRIPKDFPLLPAGFQSWPENVQERFIERLCIWSDGSLLNRNNLTDATKLAKQECKTE